MLYTVMTEGFLGHKPGELVYLNAAVGSVIQAVAAGKIVEGQRRTDAPKALGDKPAAPPAPATEPKKPKAATPRKRAPKKVAKAKEK